mgnify:CR=1 FL=1
MKAMLLDKVCDLRVEKAPLRMVDLPEPVPGPGEALIRVRACGVCHTELDEIEGRTLPARFPVILGHQVVGNVVQVNGDESDLTPGTRVGVAWINSACGQCGFCRFGKENLCPEFRGTGRDVNGGYAEYLTVPVEFALAIPDQFSDVEAAPLLCAGAIGFRSFRLSGIRNGDRLGLTGFGASAHLVMQLVKYRFPDTRVYVFARSERQREFAISLGATWTGSIDATAPVPLHAIIDTTPAWQPVMEALRNLAPGGRLVINAIRKEEFDKHTLLSMDYPAHLWMEKEIKSVANVTRSDVTEFLQLAAESGLKPAIEEFPLADANAALMGQSLGDGRGARVLRMD